MEDPEEKKRALETMVRRLDDAPEDIIERQLKPGSVAKVLVGRIDIVEMTGKKADRIIVSL